MPWAASCRRRQLQTRWRSTASFRRRWSSSWSNDPHKHRGEAMSHHYSGVDFGFPLGDARLDFCDLYAFPKPDDSTKSVLIMDVHPSKALPEGTTMTEPFSPEAIYELRVDTDGDLVADLTFRFQFSR